MAANDFLELLRRLSEAQVDFVVVGGTAAVLHGASTATYDLDILMRFDEANCTRLLTALEGQRPRLSHTPDKRPLQASAQELATFRNLYLLTELGRLDVLGSLPPLTDLETIFREAETVDLEGLRVRVVALPALIAVRARWPAPRTRSSRRSCERSRTFARCQAPDVYAFRDRSHTSPRPSSTRVWALNTARQPSVVAWRIPT